jgi:dTDP-4-amino-4,6-dideoxygalactose transaminase
MNLGKGAFPITEKAASEILSLPMFPQLIAEMQQQVAAIAKMIV